MNSVSTEIEEAPILDNNDEINQSHMDPKLFKAAVEGNLEPFKHMAGEVIERLFTAHSKNTIVHINIISQKRKNGSTKFIEKILEKCSSLLIQVNAKGDTPLHVAAKFGHSDIVSFLIERAENEELESGVEAAWQMIRMTNNEKNTALHEAATCSKNVDVVKILTREDPHYPYFANNYGQTPLYIAAGHQTSQMVLVLLKNCSSISYEGPNEKTALHAAAMHFHFSDVAVRKLVEKKKSLIRGTDQYGWTPIHYAAYHNRYYQISMLLKNDQTASKIADIDRKMTALHLAAGRGHARTVETILSLSPECYELVDDGGWNFLHYAMVSFRYSDLRKLLKNPLARSLINEGDTNGNTPFHVSVAVRRGKFKAIIMYRSQANYRAVNKQNVSVEHMCKYGYPELKEEIQNLCNDVGRGQYSDGVILKRPDYSGDDFKETRASHLVVAALIATVAFAAAFTIPGGYKSENGTAILRRNTAFQAFMVTDTIAMILSLFAVFIHFTVSLQLGLIKQFSEELFLASAVFTLFSMGAIVIAFVTGTYAMLAPSSGLAIITCVIGLSFFLFMFCVKGCSIVSKRARL